MSVSSLEQITNARLNVANKVAIGTALILVATTVAAIAGLHFAHLLTSSEWHTALAGCGGGLLVTGSFHAAVKTTIEGDLRRAENLRTIVNDLNRKPQARDNYRRRISCI